MKKAILFCYFIIFLFAAVPAQAAGDPLRLYLFYGDGCPHCVKEESFLERLADERKDFVVYRYEVWKNRENADKLKAVAQALDFDVRGVPVLIVGDQPVSGYYDDASTGKEIENLIDRYVAEGCTDRAGQVLGISDSTETECVHGCTAEGECPHDCGCNADTVATTTGATTVQLPFLGAIDARQVSIPVLTVLIAAADGFNPCAMWVLIFLISLLLGMQDRTKMWILGGTFILASGLVYFLFLAAWLNVFLYLRYVAWIRIVIGAVALGSGAWQLRHAWQNRDGGCEVVEGDKRQRIFARLRGLVTQRNFLVAALGIAGLAVAVNLVELVCSAGLPAAYTGALSLAGLPTWQYYAYLVLYIIVFMIDDLLIFIFAMATMRLKAFESGYVKYASWIGGAIMLILGLLLIVKPGWVMFG